MRHFFATLTPSDLLTAWRDNPYLERTLWAGATAVLWHRPGEKQPYFGALTFADRDGRTYEDSEPGPVIDWLSRVIAEEAPKEWWDSQK